MPPNDPFKLDYRDGCRTWCRACDRRGFYWRSGVRGDWHGDDRLWGRCQRPGRSRCTLLAGSNRLWIWALGGLIGAIYFLGRNRRRMFLAGLLLGIMLVSMIESACFYQGSAGTSSRSFSRGWRIMCRGDFCVARKSLRGCRDGDSPRSRSFRRPLRLRHRFTGMSGDFRANSL